MPIDTYVSRSVVCVCACVCVCVCVHLYVCLIVCWAKTVELIEMQFRRRFVCVIGIMK